MGTLKNIIVLYIRWIIPAYEYVKVAIMNFYMIHFDTIKDCQFVLVNSERTRRVLR